MPTNDRSCKGNQEEASRNRLGKILALIFGIAVVMGPGPGLYLVNPDSNDPETVATLGQVPILYLWVLFWFAVQAVVVLIAYFYLWGSNDE
jgi:hypothetical protein